MSIEEKEQRIIDLSIERLYLMKEIKNIKNNGEVDETNMSKIEKMDKRLWEIHKEIEELIASAKPNRS